MAAGCRSPGPDDSDPCHIDHLMQQLNLRGSQLTTALSEVDTLRGEIQDETMRTERAEQNAEKLRGTVELLEAELGELRLQIQETEMYMEMEMDKRKGVERDLARLQRTTESMEAELDELRAQVREMDMEIDERNDQVREARRIIGLEKEGGRQSVGSGD